MPSAMVSMSFLGSYSSNGKSSSSHSRFPKFHHLRTILSFGLLSMVVTAFQSSFPFSTFNGAADFLSSSSLPGRWRQQRRVPPLFFDKNLIQKTPALTTTTTTTLFYNDHVDPMVSSSGSSPSSSSSDFTQRMKMKLLEQDQRQRRSERQNDDIIEVCTLEKYKEEVADEKDRIVVVRFYAPWCRACQAMEPLYRRLSKAYSNQKRDNQSNVKFLQISVSGKNSNLHQGLDVPSIPYCHIYYPRCGLVEELRFTKKYIRKVANILDTYVRGECADLQFNNFANMYASPYKEEEEQQQQQQEEGTIISQSSQGKNMEKKQITSEVCK